MAARGGSRPGSGRPKGAINKATACIKEAAQQYTEQALAVLVEVMTTGDSAAARVAAANAVLDRGHGKPKQSLDAIVDANVTASVEVIERRLVRPSN